LGAIEGLHAEDLGQGSGQALVDELQLAQQWRRDVGMQTAPTTGAAGRRRRHPLQGRATERRAAREQHATRGSPADHVVDGIVAMGERVAEFRLPYARLVEARRQRLKQGHPKRLLAPPVADVHELVHRADLLVNLEQLDLAMVWYRTAQNLHGDVDPWMLA
jgi:hypothetical protein